MKVRNGFVSNSSSSSFIIRGIKVPKENLLSEWNLESDENLWREANNRGLRVVECRNYFEPEVEFADYIIGMKVGSLEDGEIFEVDEELLKDKDSEIESKLDSSGLRFKKLSTYIQYISNDNY